MFRSLTSCWPWNKKHFAKQCQHARSSVTASVNDRYYPRYHLAPTHGWMNDPNGFSVFNGEYHLYYQYNPNSSLEPGIAHWGHAKSKDMFHWEHLPIAMYPDEWYDKTGVFSGSAIVEDDKIYLFYTGNVNFPGQTPDHMQHQVLAKSLLLEDVLYTLERHEPVQSLQLKINLAK
ncbi:unnamed protein product, partial [Iphiclides podalirius]